MDPINDTSRHRRIGLLGGSFNPAHDGHREISLIAIDRLQLNAVWWLVTPGNPLKNASDYAPLDERLRKARLCANHENIVVSDFESRHRLQFSIDTIEQLLVFNPDTNFIWLMGADSLANFHLWQDWRRIASLVPMAIFHRPGLAENVLQSEAALALAEFRIDETNAEMVTQGEPPAWVYISETNNPISSTALRQKS